jgi:RNA-directed DNA polymerase
MGKGGSVMSKDGAVMAEDTPVNTGVLMVWPDPASAFYQVRRMQTKLHQWAKDDPSRRFDDLFNLVHDPAFLVHAWERVATNKGARTAGIDKVTVFQIETQVGVGVFLQQVRDAVKSRTFRPAPVRQVLIPKPNRKVRALGIPTVADRVVQAALKAVLEPIFEADFLPCSYGFRPNRRPHDAIAEIHCLASAPKNYEWVVDADITACFDSIDHAALMERVRARIKDKRVCALVKAFLKAGVMTQYERNDTTTGTPQGGILSPLLANIALSALDEHITGQWEPNDWQRRIRRKQDLGNWRLIRYADDFVVMISGNRQHAETILADIEQVLAPLGLALSVEKTRIAHIDEGFDFLGFHIRRRRKRGTQKQYVYTTPAKDRVQRIKASVRDATHRSTRNQTVADTITTVDNMIRGWANYFRHGVSKAVFNALDHYTWWRLMQWIRRKHNHISMKHAIHRFCNGWKPAHNGATYRGASSVTVTRYRYRGSNIPTPWTPTPATP